MLDVWRNRIPLSGMWENVNSNHFFPVHVHLKHSNAGHSGDQVYAFGSGKRGQLGISKGRVNSVCLPEVTCGLEDVEIVSIAANGDHSAALSSEFIKFVLLHLATMGKSYFNLCNVKSLMSICLYSYWNH